MKPVHLFFLIIPFAPFVINHHRSYYTKAFHFLFLLSTGSVLLAWLLLFLSWDLAVTLSTVGEIATLMILQRRNQSNQNIVKAVKFRTEKLRFVSAIFLISSLSLVIYLVAVIQLGEWTWDASNVHQPIAYGIFQNESIRDLPQVSPWQALPSAPHLYMAIWLHVFASSFITQLSMLPFICVFIYFSISWINELYAEDRISVYSRNYLYLSVIVSPPLFFSFGATYIDFYSQVLLLFLIAFVYKNLSTPQISYLDIIGIGIISAGIITSKLSTSYQVAILLTVFVTLIARTKTTILQRISKVLLLFTATSSGTVYFVRNWLDYGNPFYPYKDALKTNFANSLFTSSEMHGFLVGAAAPMIQSAGTIYGVFWNQIGSIAVWVDQNIKMLLNTLQGISPVNYQSFASGSVYALDARVAGNGILIHIGFAIIFSVVVYRFFSKKSNLEVPLLLTLIVMLLVVPGPTSGRYNWAVTYSFVIIGSTLLGNFKVQKILGLATILTVLVSLTGTVAFSSFYLNESRPWHQSVKNSFDTGSTFALISGDPKAFNEKCPTVGVVRDLRNQNTFASGFWIKGPCTRVSRYTKESSTDYIAIVENVDPVKRQLCSESLEGPQMRLADRWGQSAIIFVMGEFFSEMKMKECFY